MPVAASWWRWRKTFGLPVHAVGVGEKAGDLRPFDAMDFARGLVGADTPTQG